MARTTATPAPKGSESDQVNDPAASTAADGAAATSPNEPAAGAETSNQAKDGLGAGQGHPAGSHTVGGATITLEQSPSAESLPEVNADDKGEVTIYPLRSYLDGKEIRRAGGKGYKSPKHDAVSLIAAGLATDKKPKV